MALIGKNQREVAMKRQETMQTSQLELVELFLEEHPGFSPELIGPDALVHGFRAGRCFLTIAEMERLVTAKPHFDKSAVAFLMAREQFRRMWGGPLSDLHHDTEGLPRKRADKPVEAERSFHP
jgi:hypothetical protein